MLKNSARHSNGGGFSGLPSFGIGSELELKWSLNEKSPRANFSRKNTFNDFYWLRALLRVHLVMS